jgi:hypothetical protein
MGYDNPVVTHSEIQPFCPEAMPKNDIAQSKN